MILRKKWLNSLTIAILFTLISFAIYRLNPELLYLWELKSYDTMVKMRGSRAVSGQVVIVAIDEKSLQKEGKWPWSRTLVATLLDKISEAGSAVIGFDILFPEKDNYILFDTLKNHIETKDISTLNKESLIKWLREVGNSDEIFANSIGNSGRVVMSYSVYSTESQAKEVASKLDEKQSMVLEYSQYSIVQRTDDPKNPAPLRHIYGHGMSISELVNEANSMGYVSFVAEIDGTVRWVPMVLQYGQYLYPPLNIQMLKEAVQLPLSVLITPYGVDNVRLGDLTIPTNEVGDYLVNYYGPGQTFTHYSATDVLSGKIGAAELKGKIVLIGATAAGAHDLHVTPFGPLCPGAEINATIIENILSNDHIVRPDWFALLDIGMIFGSGLLLGLVSLYLGPLMTMVFLLVGVVGYLILNYYVFTRMGMWVNTIYPVFTQIFVYTGMTLWKIVYEEKQKRFIQKAFSKYLSPVMVEELAKNPELLQSGGKEQVMTVSFSDMVGFTSVSESMSYPELSKHMNEYFTEMTAIILEEHGTVTQYAGDLVMAIYGAPIPTDDHAHHGVMAAVKMRRRLDELNVIWGKRGLPELGVRTGINSDYMFFGNLGSEQVYYYSVLGDSVNTAARLESANKQYGTNIMISENTLLKLQEGVFRTRLLDIVQVKGKTTAVKIYDVYGETNIEVNPEELKYYSLYSEGFEDYLSRNFSTAKKAFEEALIIKPDDVAAKRMLERVTGMDSAKLPSDWDGTFVMTSK
ncbi:MAG: adenylate/guanylate cyclase domain-containing protein [Nitrospinae bacterium]|nr:adenylate/guanylate cyclase domain-containing protein [Nitrospinota bacterium]